MTTSQSVVIDAGTDWYILLTELVMVYVIDFADIINDGIYHGFDHRFGGGTYHRFY